MLLVIRFYDYRPAEYLDVLIRPRFCRISNANENADDIPVKDRRQMSHCANQFMIHSTHLTAHSPPPIEKLRNDLSLSHFPILSRVSDRREIVVKWESDCSKSCLIVVCQSLTVLVRERYFYASLSQSQIISSHSAHYSQTSCPDDKKICHRSFHFSSKIPDHT